MIATTRPWIRTARWIQLCRLASAIGVICSTICLHATCTAAAQMAIGHGLRLEVDTNWPAGAGYRPLTFTVKPLKPLPADRRITLQVIQMDDPWGSGYGYRLVKHLELPAGSGPVQTTISVPTTAVRGKWKVEVSEEGTPLSKLTLGWSENAFFDMDEAVVAERLPHVLYVGREAPESLQQVFEQILSKSFVVGAPNRELALYAVRFPKELPEQWIDYTSVDLVIIGFSDLVGLRTKRRAAFEALRGWVFAGGNLVVLGVDLDGCGLEKLAKLLDFPPHEPPALEGQSDDWQMPRRESNRSELLGEPVSVYYEAEVALEVTVDAETADPEGAVSHKTETPSPVNPGFRLRPLGLGMVVAVSAENIRFVENRQWRWLLNDLGPERWQWPQRVGLSTLHPNNHFWDFLIPGVGLAPVTEFCILITLFAVGIGPVNYFLLRRWKKLHLLMFTVPGGAAAVTLLLMLYAVVSDGLGVRTRVRSVTCIDQRTGNAACWARLSYYAGLAPSGGLVFSPDVAVIPLEPTAFNPFVGRSRPRREVVLAADGTQQLVSGWLPSRTPTQLLTIRSRRTRARLEVAPAANKPGRWTLTNRLGVRIEQVLVCTEQGKYGWAAGVEPDERVELQPIDSAVALKRLQERCRAQRLGWPEGMTDVPSSGWSGAWRWAWSGLFEVTDRDSRLEHVLSTITAVGSPELLRPGPRTYLAVTQTSPEVQLGTPRAREEDSLHVIVGNW